MRKTKDTETNLGSKCEVPFGSNESFCPAPDLVYRNHHKSFPPLQQTAQQIRLPILCTVKFILVGLLGCEQNVHTSGDPMAHNAWVGVPEATQSCRVLKI